MNAPEFGVKFVSKQAVDPTPQLYDELVADSMEKLANASAPQRSPVAPLSTTMAAGQIVLAPPSLLPSGAAR